MNPSPEKKIRKKIESKESAEWWMKHLAPQGFDNPETYVDRVVHSIVRESFFDDFSLEEKKDPALAKVDWDKAEPLIFKEAKTLTGRIPERMPFSSLNRQLGILNGSFRGIHNPTTKKFSDATGYFTQTNRDRSFEEEGDGPDMPLISRLFSLPNLTPEHAREIIADRLDGKRIMLLGGGDSVNDLIQKSDIMPAEVVNADPFLITEPSDKNVRKNYRSIGVEAQDPKLLEQGIGRFEEVWATWSVPLYLQKSESIRQVFQNVDGLLVPGGVFRVYPLALLNFKWETEVFPDAEHPDILEAAWVESVAELLRTGRYNMEVLGGTMYLQKLAD